ncbi:delphilin-like [Ammospiza maritima maritima]
MPATNQGWPESFGFGISGSGPCYILWVQEGSSAALAGLRPGDEVLELEGRPVSRLGREALRALARRCGSVPPSIGVVSRLQRASVPPGPRGRFGFELGSESPPRVASVSPASPAAACGLEPGDLLLEVDGAPVAGPEAAAALVGSCRGRCLRLALLRPQRGDAAGDDAGDAAEDIAGDITGDMAGDAAGDNMGDTGPSAGPAHRDRRQKAQEFSRKVRPVDAILGQQPQLKEKLFAVLKQYAAQRSVEGLARGLSPLLTHECHQPLMDSISTQFEHKRSRSR